LHQIRPATEADISALAALHIAGWQGAYGGLVDNEFLKIPTLEDRIKSWEEWIHLGDCGTHLAVTEDGQPVGFVSYGRLKTPPPGSSPIRPLYSAEIYGLYLLPDYYRQGIGTKLMGHAITELKDMRHKSLCLWVLEKNSRAVSFYKKQGGERCGKHDIQLGTTTAREICFGWREMPLL